MSRQCAGVKRDGGSCTVSVQGPQEFCHLHDPLRAQERRRNASRAGKSKANRELRRLIDSLETLKADVLSGSVDRNDASVVVQTTRAQTALIELERKIKEQDEILERIEALEGVRETRITGGGTKPWG